MKQDFNTLNFINRQRGNARMLMVMLMVSFRSAALILIHLLESLRRSADSINVSLRLIAHVQCQNSSLEKHHKKRVSKPQNEIQVAEILNHICCILHNNINNSAHIMEAVREKNSEKLCFLLLAHISTSKTLCCSSVLLVGKQ